MKRPSLVFLIPLVLFTVALVDLDNIRLLYENAQESPFHFILLISILSVLFISFIMPLIFYGESKILVRRKELEEKIDLDTNPKYAERFRHYGKTPDKGNHAVVVNEDLWVVIQWDRQKNELKITTPPGHENRTPVQVLWYNGKFEEVQKVKAEDLPRIS